MCVFVSDSGPQLLGVCVQLKAKWVVVLLIRQRCNWASLWTVMSRLIVLYWWLSAIIRAHLQAWFFFAFLLPSVYPSIQSACGIHPSINSENLHWVIASVILLGSRELWPEFSISAKEEAERSRKEKLYRNMYTVGFEGSLWAESWRGSRAIVTPVDYWRNCSQIYLSLEKNKLKESVENRGTVQICMLM